MDNFEQTTHMSHVAGRDRAFIDRIAYLAFQIFVFLLPIFFVPISYVSFQSSRPAFVLLGLAVVLFIWIIARLKDGVFKLPKSLFYLSFLVPLVTYALASLFSKNVAISVSGYNFELGTLIMMVASFLIFAITPLLITNEEQIRRIYKISLVSFVVVALYQFGKLFISPEFLSFGLLSGRISNLIGKWNDLAVFAGAMVLFATIMLDRDKMIDKSMKIILWVTLLVSVLILIFVNFGTVWTTLAFALLISFVYGVSTSWVKRESEDFRTNLPLVTLVTLIFAVILTFAGPKIGGMLSNSLGISNIEARPSWGLTLDITKTTLKTDPLFGIGPNRFANLWLQEKPTDINNTIFWNLSFNSGIGFVPSMVATSGLIGFLGMLVFIVMLLVTGFKSLFNVSADHPARSLLIASLATTLFLWALSIIYVPSVTTWVLTLLSTGLFVSSAIATGTVQTFKVSAVDSQIKSFVAVLLCVLLLIGTAFFAYKVSTKVVANAMFQKSLNTVRSSGNIDEGENLVGRAIALSPVDSYYRLLSDLYLVRLSNLLSDSSVLQSEAQARFQGILGTAIQAAQQAIALDSTNSQNHIQLGRVYEAIVPLGVQGAFDSSKQAYESAIALNPENPETYLLLARLSATNNDIDSARSYVQESLIKKSDYGDAIYFLSQIEIAAGRLAEAVRAVESLAFLSPNDPGVFFQLGFLKYNQRNYNDAVLALERAVSLNNEYANAKYFLGLSYYEAKRNEDAIGQFRDLASSNPDNEEVKAILSNLEAGKAPFSGLNTNRENLPIDE